jgi:hypothetical protein
METPVSYQIAIGLASIGAALKRNAYISQANAGTIYPNLSILLVGPSGLGKDTAINMGLRMIRTNGIAPEITGTTIEAIKTEMLRLGDPAAGYIVASEMAAKFGKQDYKTALIPELTDILSDNESIAVTLKSHLEQRDSFGGITQGQGKRILHPTVTLFGGSTLDWLHEMMPDGSLAGGFIPRLLVIKEDYGRALAHDPGPQDAFDRRMVSEAEERYTGRMIESLQRFIRPTSMFIAEDAENFYANWYHNRHKYFTPLTAAYAQRARGLFYKISMLCAVSRNSAAVDLVDVEFAAEFMTHIARYLEDCAIPPTREYKVGKEILKLLPGTRSDILRDLMARYPRKDIYSALDLLIESGSISFDTGVFYKTKAR